MGVWTQRVEKRKWMRILGWIALAAVVGQGVLGGLTVLNLSAVDHLHRACHAGTNHLLRVGGDGPVHQPPQLVAGRAAPSRTRPLAQHTYSGGVGGGVRVDPVDPWRGLPSLRHKASAAPDRSVRRHRDGLLDDRPRADALQRCSPAAQAGAIAAGAVDAPTRPRFCCLSDSAAMDGRSFPTRHRHCHQHGVARRRRRAGAGHMCRAGHPDAGA